MIYINEQIKREEWTFYDVGHTTFNDEALRQTGEFFLPCRHVKPPFLHVIITTTTTTLKPSGCLSD